MLSIKKFYWANILIYSKNKVGIDLSYQMSKKSRHYYFRYFEARRLELNIFDIIRLHQRRSNVSSLWGAKI